MITIMLIIENERERQILKTGFEQNGAKIIISDPSYANYLKAIQYNPDFMLLELPRVCMDHLHFASLIRKHRITKKTAILGYGEPIIDAIKKGIMDKGITNYFPRPLKFSVLMATITKISKALNKTMDTRPAPSDKEADLQLILDPQTLPEKKIDLMVSHVSKLLAFPFTVTKVMQLAESEKSSAADLAKVIEADPVITTNILKVSNTVFFAAANRKINSIKDAIIRIGFRETKRLVTGMSVMKLFSTDTNSLGFNRVAFWYHSLAVGVISENIGRRIGSVSAEEAYLSGLLHDFGVIILDEFFPTLFASSLEKATNTGGSFIDAEHALFGVTHNDIAKRLFEEWKMPTSIIDGIYNRNAIGMYRDHFDTPGKSYALCTTMADILAKSLAFGKECDQVVECIETWEFNEAKLTSGFGKDFLDAAMHELNLFKQFLKLDDTDAGTKSSDDATSVIGVYNCEFSMLVSPLLYLKTCGYETIALKTPSLPSEFDKLCDCIVITAGESVTADMLTLFTNVLRKSASQTSNDSNLIVPLLIITSESSPIRTSELFSKATFLPETYDLRELEKVTVELTQAL